MRLTKRNDVREMIAGATTTTQPSSLQSGDPKPLSKVERLLGTQSSHAPAAARPTLPRANESNNSTTSSSGVAGAASSYTGSSPAGVEGPDQQHRMRHDIQTHSQSHTHKQKHKHEQRERKAPDNQNTLGSLWSAHEAYLDTIIMPGAHGGLKPWPSVQQSNASMNDYLVAQRLRTAAPAPSTADSQQYVPRGRESNSNLRSYYDAARQPLHISQQTSASAVRDMGLHRGATKMPKTLSESDLRQRPLKSALKQQSPPKERKVRSRDGSSSRGKGERRMPKLDLAGLLSRHAPSGQAPRLRATPSDLSLNSVDIPHGPSASERMHHLRPTDGMTRNLSAPASAPSASTARPKPQEDDMLGSAKTNVRRPPKGIQNWFDGFDISSDEEEQAPVELPASPVPPYARPQEVVLNKRLPAAPDVHLLEAQRPEHPRPKRNKSDDIVFENLLMIEQARKLMGSRDRESGPSVDANAASSSLSGPGRKRGGESRLASSRLANESVLSLSSESEDERPRLLDLPEVRDSLSGQSDLYDAIVGDAAPMDLRRPSIPPRQLYSKQFFPRESYSTIHTSGSIPISFDHDIPMPPLFDPEASFPTIMKQNSVSRHTAATLRQLTGQRESLQPLPLPLPLPPPVQPLPPPPPPPPPPARESSRVSSPQEYPESTAGASSTYSDGSHFMAVTEEEMALLEMMRSKRAAMAKDSFTEGYRVALKREQEQLAMRRQSAQVTALKILKQKHAKEKGRQGSRDSEDHLPVLHEEQWRRMSAIKKEAVDQELKIERFLAMEGALEDVFPNPPKQSTPEVEQSPKGTEQTLLPSTTYTPRPRQKKSAASLLDSARVAEEEDSDSETAKLQAELSRFLAAGGRTDSTIFPTPPKSTANLGRSRKSSALLSPPSSLAAFAEEPVPTAPAVPLRSPNRLAAETASDYMSIRRPSNATELESVLGAAMGAPSSKRSDNSSLLHPHSDLQGFDFPIAGGRNTSSPSITSRASPLTPTFTPTLPVHAHTKQTTPTHVEIAGFDSSSQLAYSSDHSQSKASETLSASRYHANGNSGVKEPKKRKEKPPAVDTIAAGAHHDSYPGRLGSVASITSAGEDVLAAWAELGGGTDAFYSSRRLRH